MLATSRIRIPHVLRMLVCIPLMILVGIVQAVGIVLTAISAIVLKTIGVLMIFVTVLLLIFGMFTWAQTLVVLLIGASMFWVPEGLGLALLGLTFVQAKLMDLMDR